jgi:hypothetical protein
MKKWLFWLGNGLLVAVAITSLVASIWSLVVPNPYRWHIRGSQGFPYILTLDSLALTLEHWSGKSSGSFKFSVYPPIIFLLTVAWPAFEFHRWRERKQVRKKTIGPRPLHPLRLRCSNDARALPRMRQKSQSMTGNNACFLLLNFYVILTT